MQITVDAKRPVDAAVDLLALFIVEIEEKGAKKPKLAARFNMVDRALRGRIADVIAHGDFRGKTGQTTLLYPGDSGGLRAKRILLVGLGKATSLEIDALRKAAGTAIHHASGKNAAKVALALPNAKDLAALSLEGLSQALAEGCVLSAYRFDRYREKPKDRPREVSSVAISIEKTSDLRAARAGAKRGAILAECQNVARDLSNEPGNSLPPAALAREAVRVAKEVGLRSKVMEVPELKRRKMGALLAVGAGSSRPPCLIVLEHGAARGKKKAGAKTLCFVGKGITFDSGGISIKPSAGVEDMKHDISGAAAVVGAMRACALLKVPFHVVGVIAAAENLPSSTAYRPGDVVTAMSGKTIEVLNTDAEGRVVLADALHYARTEYSPVAMLDLATLTGACMVALGKHATGLFTNDEALCAKVKRAGEATSERAWELPLWEGHNKAIRSAVADIKNTGGRNAGASTAAAFLQHFVGETPWVHLDIAGTGWGGRSSSYQGKGATGVGVRLLIELLRSWDD